MLLVFYICANQRPYQVHKVKLYTHPYSQLGMKHLSFATKVKEKKHITEHVKMRKTNLTTVLLKR